MTTRHLLSNLTRVALAVVCLCTAAACGGDLLRTGRSPVYLVITRITATEGGEGGASNTAFLQSDVLRKGSVFNDNVTVTVRVDRKNTAAATTTLNSVTLTRYRVTFRRTDGRNTPGVDVPYGFDGALNGTLNADGSQLGLGFEIVRHQAKLEPPLKNMVGLGGLGLISTIAEITIWGHDQNGNELTATGSIDVHFADFGDPA